MSSCKCKEVLAKVAELESRIEEMVLANNAIVSRIANNIELKLDILANSEQMVSSQKSSIKKAKTKPVFFKDLVKESYSKYMDVLYSSDRVDELLELEEVKSKKTQATKMNKVADFLYKDFKNNKAYQSKFDEIYAEYKNSLEVEEEEETKED
jgi:hypothetical protein